MELLALLPRVIRPIRGGGDAGIVLTFTLVAVSLALGASACGGDDSDASSDASADVVEQIEEICTDWRETLDERGGFPVDGFDPANPSPEDLPTVGEYFASGHPAAEDAIAKLRQLSPPADVEARIEALVSAVEQQLESAKNQASAALVADVAAYQATLDEAASSLEAVQDASDQLGAQSCAF